MIAKVDTFRWGRAANEEARAKREARLVEIGDIKNIPVRIGFICLKKKILLHIWFSKKDPFLFFFYFLTFYQGGQDQ